MLELLILITLAGLILSSSHRMGIANPFQIYFAVWFIIFLWLDISADKYINISDDFIFLLIGLKLLSFSILLAFFPLCREKPITLKPIEISKSQDSWILLAQIIVIAALPFVYDRALAFTEGIDILSIAGHIKLRAVMTNDGPDFGLLSYFFTLSYVVSSLTIFSYRQQGARLARLLLSILVSFSYIYLSTGRTNVLLFSCLIFMPLIINKIIGMKGMLISALAFAVVFVFLSLTTSKGISIDDIGWYGHIIKFWNHLENYTIVPLVAFFKLLETNPASDLGVHTFRFFIALQYALGLSDLQPVSLIKDYIYVYDPINVYTVYEVYFRDFSHWGMLIPPTFLIMHYWLYQKANRFSGVWTFYYSASVYPLVMQFFQDQYFSLISTWIQIGFWYWFFIVPKRMTLYNTENRENRINDSIASSESSQSFML